MFKDDDVFEDDVVATFFVSLVDDEDEKASPVTEEAWLLC